MHTKPVIATIDIETSPYEAYVWSLWQVNVGLEQIKEDRTILSFGYKPLGKPTVFMSTGGRGAGRVRDDYAVCLALAKLLDDTDIVVAQNGDKFDVRVINSRLIQHGIAPYSPIRAIDTLKVAKRVADFASNRLEWLDRVVNGGKGKDKHAKYMGQELWNACLRDEPGAWKVLEKYNKADVLKTERLYLNLLPWIANHPNLGVYTAHAGHKCPNCVSPNVQSRGIQVTQASIYERFHCQDCGHWSRSKKMLSSPAARKARLS